PEEVGIPPRMRERVRSLTSEKRGLIAVCGPPRSGVTTATIGVVRCIDSYLYTIYNMADLDGRDLAHVVDFKTGANDDLETTIGRALRVEADMILMDPIRDAETAATIFKMQGKVAFIAEVAARDAAYGILQLNRWLGDPELVARGLVAAVSQKMVRLLCSKCKEAYRPNPKMAARIGLPPETRVLYRPPTPPVPTEGVEVEAPEPCNACGETGYLGRTTLFEFIEMTEGMRAVIAAGPTVESIKRQAKKENMLTFQQEGLRLVAEGRTSLEELQRLFKAQ
ncbi:MAG: ATPase, T2SS/T4P/T4SS family, partial [Planctomycetaceae bacterium]